MDSFPGGWCLKSADSYYSEMREWRYFEWFMMGINQNSLIPYTKGQPVNSMIHSGSMQKLNHQRLT